MATYTVTLSQDVVDKSFALSNSQNAANINPSGILDLIISVQASVDAQHSFYDSYYYNDIDLEVYYPDGAVETYFDVVLANPGAFFGMATVSEYQIVVPNRLVIYAAGELVYNYEDIENDLSWEFNHHIIEDYLFITTAPSHQTHPILGNVAFGLSGEVSILNSGIISGFISEIFIANENLVEYEFWSGDFTVSGDLFEIGGNTGESFVSGRFFGLERSYYDGSSVQFIIDNPNGIFLADNSNPITLLDNPANFPGNDTFSIDLPNIYYQERVYATGPGDDTIFLSGAPGKVGIFSGAGDDQISKGSLGHQINGGTGSDTVSYEGASANYEISFDADTSAILVKALSDLSLSDKVRNVEYLQFDDILVKASDVVPNSPVTGALLIYGDAEVGKSLLAESRGLGDANGLGDFAYQWYRNGDAISGQTGANYTLTEVDDGQQISASVHFMDGVGHEEFVMGESRLVSTPTSASYTELIQMYVIILGRAPAQGGLDFWSGIINDGHDFNYVAGEMWDSAGAREFYPSGMTTEEVVTSVYTNILVREPKEAGLNYWVGRWEEYGPVETMLEMIAALTANNSSDPLAIADKELFQSKVDLGGYLANTVGNTDVELARAAFDYLESGYSVEETRLFIDTEMGIIGQAQMQDSEDLFA
jgi:Domain of unknown function (DUF4214)